MRLRNCSEDCIYELRQVFMAGRVVEVRCVVVEQPSAMQRWLDGREVERGIYRPDRDAQMVDLKFV